MSVKGKRRNPKKKNKMPKPKRTIGTPKKIKYNVKTPKNTDIPSEEKTKKIFIEELTVYTHMLKILQKEKHHPDSAWQSYLFGIHCAALNDALCMIYSRKTHPEKSTDLFMESQLMWNESIKKVFAFISDMSSRRHHDDEELKKETKEMIDSREALKEIIRSKKTEIVIPS